MNIKEYVVLTLCATTPDSIHASGLATTSVFVTSISFPDTVREKSIPLILNIMLAIASADIVVLAIAIHLRHETTLVFLHEF